MENQETISIKEYAEAKGISVQAVYKRLNKPLNPLNPFVVEVESKKRLLKSVLEADLEDKPFNPHLTTDSTPEVEIQPPKSLKVETLEEELKRLSKIVEELQETREEESKKREEEVKFLREQIKIKDEQISARDEQIKNLTSKNDLLLAKELKLDTQIVDTQGSQVHPREEKKNFFTRFFGR